MTLTEQHKKIPNLSLQVFTWDDTSFPGTGTHPLLHAKNLDREERMLTFHTVVEVCFIACDDRISILFSGKILSKLMFYFLRLYDCILNCLILRSAEPL